MDESEKDVTMSELEELQENPEKLKDFIANPKKVEALIDNPPHELKGMMAKIKKTIAEHVQKDIEHSKKHKDTISNGELWEFIQQHKDDTLLGFTHFVQKRRNEKDICKVLRAFHIFNDLVKKGRVVPDKLWEEE